MAESWADIVRGSGAGKAWADIVDEDDRSTDIVEQSSSDAGISYGDPVGIRAIQSILMSATQMNLSHFHTAGMDGAARTASASVAGAGTRSSSASSERHSGRQPSVSASSRPATSS